MTTTTTATLREAITSDAGAILTLMAQFYDEDGCPFDESAARNALLRLLEDRSLGRVWVVQDGDALIGYAALTYGYSLEYLGRDAFVDEIYIANAHRGRGHASRALATIEAACRDAGVRALHLEVQRNKDMAASLYRMRGFVDHDRYLMTKSLTG